MPHRPKRTRVVTAVTAALVLGLSSLAGASETTVSTEAAEPSRQLEVLDLAGQPLDEMRLRHGHAQPFEVRVTDNDQAPDHGFTVDTTMNNLHLVDEDGHSAEEAIASEHVDLSFPGSPLGAAGVHADLEPTYLLESTEPITCGLVSDLLDLGSLLGGDPLCDLLANLHDLNLLGLTDDDTMDFDGVELVGSLIDAVDLDELDLPALPLVPQHGEAGAFETPECSTGIGSEFCAGGSPTVRQALRGEAAGSLTGELEAVLESALSDAVDLVGDDGLVDVEDVLSALATSDAPLLDDAGDPLGDTVATLGQVLGEYDGAEQVEVINRLFEASLQDLGLEDLLHLSGRYSSYPALTVDTASAAVGGAYEGTLTVTLIE